MRLRVKKRVWNTKADTQEASNQEPNCVKRRKILQRKSYEVRHPLKMPRLLALQVCMYDR